MMQTLFLRFSEYVVMIQPHVRNNFACLAVLLVLGILPLEL